MLSYAVSKNENASASNPLGFLSVMLDELQSFPDLPEVSQGEFCYIFSIIHYSWVSIQTNLVQAFF